MCFDAKCSSANSLPGVAKDEVSNEFLPFRLLILKSDTVDVEPYDANELEEEPYFANEVDEE